MPFAGGRMRVILVTFLAGSCCLGFVQPGIAAATGPPNGLEIGAPELTYDADLPDPSVLVVDGTEYAYSTNVGGENLPVVSSDDTIHWRTIGDAMAFLPTWAAGWSGFTWAPSVSSAPGGGYEVFFSALTINGQECIGRATAPTPTGPFLDTSSTPIVCGRDEGAIDPFLFRTAIGDYLVWKSDNGKAKSAQIWSQRLSSNDSSLVGSSALLLTADRSWEAGIVEGPALAEVGGALYLFFSANRWDTREYSIGVTSCVSPLGPCDDAGAHVVLSSRVGMSGPGGPDVFSLGGHEYLAFSAWTGGGPGTAGSVRALFVSSLKATATMSTTARDDSESQTRRHSGSP